MTKEMDVRAKNYQPPLKTTILQGLILNSDLGATFLRISSDA